MKEKKNFEPISATPEAVYQLAVDIDRFMEDYDTYGYRDNVGDVRDVHDKEANIQNIAHDIDHGRTCYLKNGLQECIDDDSELELTKTAESLLRRLNLMRCNH